MPREAIESLVEPLRRLGDLHEDAVGVGVFLKRQRKPTEVRPKATRLRVTAFLRAAVPSPAVVRRLPIGDRVLHVVDLRATADVDGPLADLLLERGRTPAEGGVDGTGRSGGRCRGPWTTPEKGG